MKHNDGSQESLAQTPEGHFQLLLKPAYVSQEVLDYPLPGSGTEEDPYLVEFIPKDSRNPKLFTQTQKWSYTVVMAIATLSVAFSSSSYTGGIEEIIRNFECTEEVATLGVSLFVLGFAIGPLFWAPLSELYGRQFIFAVSFGLFTVFNAACTGSKNIASLLIFRFLAGSFGSSPLTNAGGVISDLFEANQRGLASTLFSAAPSMGPILGPIVGGFVGQTVGWKWVLGVTTMFTGCLWFMGMILVPETYAPVILKLRAEALSKKTGKKYISILEKNNKKTPRELFKNAIYRPLTLLFVEPICLLLSIYMAILYGTLYLTFGAFPIVYQQNRGWSQGIGGLAFLGVAVGTILGLFYYVWDNNRYLRVAKNSPHGMAPPEARLAPLMLGSIAIPIALIWFAWTNYKSIHWIVPIISMAPFGFGLNLCFLGTINYLIDSYVIFAASVLAANSVLRSMLGFAFPLFTVQMYANLGIHWATMIPAFLALICTPFPFIFLRYGERIRRKCKYAAQAAEFMDQLRIAHAAEASRSPDSQTLNTSENTLENPEVVPERKEEV